MILLRFRDLSIPDGETIRRHIDVIESRGYVWWGWIMRAQERHPVEVLAALSRLAVMSEQTVEMLHTGTIRVYEAKVTAVHGDLVGTRTLTPEIDHTPAYMHESSCPIWFRLVSIHAVSVIQFTRVLSFPTLDKCSAFEDTLLTKQPVLASDFTESGATLWEIEP
jgi:hypothetical protein